MRRELFGRRSRRGRVHAVLFGLLLGTAGRDTLAKEPAPTDTAVSVTYEVPLGCPKVDYFQQRVRDRAPRAQFVEQGERAFRVSAHAEEERWVGELAALPAVDESSVRRVSGASCGDVIAALSLIAAVAIDPAAANEPASSASATGQQDAQSAQAAEATVPRAPPARPPAPVQPAVPKAQNANGEPGGAPESGVRGKEPTRWEVSLAVDAVTAFGKAPAPLFGIGASVGAGPVAPPGRLLSWFVVFSATELFPRKAGDPLKAEFGGQFLTLEGSFLRFVFGKVVVLRPYLGIEAGRLVANGVEQESLATTQSQTALFGSAVQTLRVTVELGRPFALEAVGILAEPFSHDSFGYQRPPVPIFTIPAVTGSVALGVRLSLW